MKLFCEYQNTLSNFSTCMHGSKGGGGGVLKKLRSSKITEKRPRTSPISGKQNYSTELGREKKNQDPRMLL